jgi:hypothetical protein
MIITDEFVMLNLPKTGSSFARAILKTIHKYDTWGSRLRRKLNIFPNYNMVEHMVPEINAKHLMGQRGQHGTYRQIPEEHRHKTIVSIIRNPFDRYVSLYLFDWWKRYPYASPDRLRQHFPKFPNLSFEEYYKMSHLFGRESRLQGIKPSTELGLLTIQFIQFYFMEPENVLRKIDKDYIETKQYQHDMAQVTFLHQENLNEELYTFLLRMGYRDPDIRFIREAERINVTEKRDEASNLGEFYTPELCTKILARESLLFELSPEYKSIANQLQRTKSTGNLNSLG